VVGSSWKARAPRGQTKSERTADGMMRTTSRKNCHTRVQSWSVDRRRSPKAGPEITHVSLEVGPEAVEREGEGDDASVEAIDKEVTGARRERLAGRCGPELDVVDGRRVLGKRCESRSRVNIRTRAIFVRLGGMRLTLPQRPTDAGSECPKQEEGEESRRDDRVGKLLECRRGEPDDE
jgi:hypothetical protein